MMITDSHALRQDNYWSKSTLICLVEFVQLLITKAVTVIYKCTSKTTYTINCFTVMNIFFIIIR